MTNVDVDERVRERAAAFASITSRPWCPLTGLTAPAQAALFDRYSRSPQSLRRLLVDHFLPPECGQPPCCCAPATAIRIMKNAAIKLAVVRIAMRMRGVTIEARKSTRTLSSCLKAIAAAQNTVTPMNRLEKSIASGTLAPKVRRTTAAVVRSATKANEKAATISAALSTSANTERKLMARDWTSRNPRRRSTGGP